ncbi:MAG: hypothetical protein D6748_02150, partial [Calditrichaeota bacterium]
AKLVHPNIVTIYEVGEAESGRYIAMEYVAGISLDEVLNSGQDVSIERGIHIISQLLSGLECAHQVGIYHRDIKPENILITPDDRVKILDFGIAKMAAKEGLTVAGDIMGTIEYMAPEQMMGEEADHRCDIYSTGVLLYQILTKKLPFTGDTSVAILYKQLNEDPIPPSELNPAISSELEQVILKALAKEKEDRWESARAFNEALLKVLRGVESRKKKIESDADWNLNEELEGGEDASRSGEKFQPVFVGREKEFSRLVRLYRKASQGKGCTVVISGEAGVGKSTIAMQLQEYARKHQAFVLYGASLYQEGMDAYMPYIDALRGFFSKDSHLLPAENRLQIKNLVREKIPVLMEFTERFSTTFGGEGSISTPPDQSNSPNILEGIHLLISLISTMRPVVVVIDDMQWADEASLRLFHYLSRHISENRILQVGICRTDRFDLQQNGKPAQIVDILSRMRREDIFDEVTLNRFSREMCEKLVDETLGSVNFTEEFYEIIYQETKGNPFFVLETLKLLNENGTIYLQDGVWYNRSDQIKLEVPNRVEDVFVRQFRELSDQDREILQVASVIGYKFDATILARLLGMRRIDLLKTLHRFQTDLQLLNSNEDGFQFEHPMLKELLYNEIPPALRKEYHLMIAQELEMMYGPEFGALVGDVANHYLHAGEEQKALPLLYQAANRAFKISAYRQASLFFEALMDIWKKRQQLPEGATLSELYLKLGICYEENGLWEKSLTVYQYLLELSQTEEDPQGQIGALRRMGRIYDHQGKFEKALEMYNHCLEILEKHPLQNVRSMIYNNMGLVYFQKGEYQLAREYFEKTIEAVDCEVGEIDKAHASTNLGIIASIHGDLNEALNYYQTALEIYLKRGNTRQLPRVYHNMGMAYSDLGEWEKSVQAFEKCLEMLDSADSKHLRGLTYLNLGKAYARQGNLEDARSFTDKAFKLFKRLGDSLSLAEVFNVMGYIFAEMNDFTRAEKYLKKSIRMNEDNDYQEGVAESCFTYARILDKQGKNKEAMEYFKKSADKFKELNLYSRTEAVLAEMENMLLREQEFQFVGNESS